MWALEYLSLAIAGAEETTDTIPDLHKSSSSSRGPCSDTK